MALMRKIEAIVRHYMMEDVKRALENEDIPGMTEGIPGMTVEEVRKVMNQGAECTADLLPMVKLTFLISDEMAKQVCDVIVKAAQTGEVGDGTIVVSELEKVVRIRTGEEDEKAI